MNLKSYDNLELKVFPYTVDRPKLNIIFVHGYTDHSGRYQELRRRLNECGFSITFYDQRGYGTSDGKRGYVEDFDDYCKDLDAVVKSHYRSGIPNLLMGVSMGGCIITKYLIDYGEGGIAGAILLSPMLKISDDVAPLLRKVSALLVKVVPGLETVKLESAALSRDPQIVKNYEEDPLVYHGGTIVKTGVEMMEAIKYVQKNYEKITLPVLVLHGTADRLTDPMGSATFIDHISSRDKMYLEYPGFYHELLNEPDKNQVYEDVIAWLNNEDRWINADTGQELA